tara:strand:- start:1328 stop:2242 length:915 start_codon:yes stop_codon:yes gene_type:complete
MNNYSTRINSIIDNLQMPDGMNESKEIIKARFVDEVDYYEKKRDKTKKYYNIFRFIVTTGSILLPALLSIGQMDPNKLPKNFDQISYWSTWSISLLVTISNGFLQLFSLDKNFFSYSLVVEQLKTEGWQYFGLSGKYEEYDNHSKEAYKEFCKAVENIKRKQIEQEFQGKGNNTKKKDINNKSPLMDFDFDGQMKSFMEKSKNNEMFKPLVNTVNTVSNLDNLKNNVVNNIKESVTENIKESITENIKETVNDNLQSTLNSVENNISANVSDIENNIADKPKPKPPPPPKPTTPLDDTNRKTTQ